MNTYNIRFHGEIRKILCGYPLLSVAMEIYSSIVCSDIYLFIYLFIHLFVLEKSYENLYHCKSLISGQILQTTNYLLFPYNPRILPLPNQALDIHVVLRLIQF